MNRPCVVVFMWLGNSTIQKENTGRTKRAMSAVESDSYVPKALSLFIFPYTTALRSNIRTSAGPTPRGAMQLRPASPIVHLRLKST